MPEEPAISPDEPVIGDASAQDTAVYAQQTAAYEPIEDQDEWLEDSSELPRRPRRRLLSPVPLALLGVLLIACGFIAGVLVEKGQTSSGSSASAAGGLAARFAALRGGASGASGSSGAAGSFGGGGLAGAGGATSGSVANLSGNTLYVTTAEGNTVKVTASPATTVTKTVKSEVKAIHPGETVTITGATASNGSISAEAIRVGGERRRPRRAVRWRRERQVQRSWRRRERRRLDHEGWRTRPLRTRRLSLGAHKAVRLTLPAVDNGQAGPGAQRGRPIVKGAQCITSRAINPGPRRG